MRIAYPDSMMRSLLVATGTTSAFLGAVGIFVPLLPTTPFLLLSAYCFSKSSPVLHSWLVTHRHLGPCLARYRAGQQLSPRDLTVTLAFLWASITGSVVFAMPHPAGKAALLGVATVISVYLVRRGQGSRGKAVRPDGSV